MSKGVKEKNGSTTGVVAIQSKSFIEWGMYFNNPIETSRHSGNVKENKAVYIPLYVVVEKVSKESSLNEA